MANFIREKLSTGNSKIYYQVENEFDVVGTLFTNWDMHYTAAHPTKGLWVCSHTLDNKPIVIGFIKWDNIKRIVVDEKNEAVFIILRDLDSVIENMDTLNKIYKKSITHQMSDNGEMSICLPTDIFSGGMLPYLSNRFPTEYKEEKIETSLIMTIIVYIVFILVAIAIILKFIDIFV